MPIDEIALASTQAWPDAHPDQAIGIMATSRSCVFFHEPEGVGPVDARDVPLIAGRSLAEDDAFLTCGVPGWLATTLPGQRFTVARDTAAIHGDIFLGGVTRAGAMQSPGCYRIPVFLPAWRDP